MNRHSLHYIDLHPEPVRQDPPDPSPGSGRSTLVDWLALRWDGETTAASYRGASSCDRERPPERQGRG